MPPLRFSGGPQEILGGRWCHGCVQAPRNRVSAAKHYFFFAAFFGAAFFGAAFAAFFGAAFAVAFLAAFFAISIHLSDLVSNL
jgi:hypothetical protein